MDDNDIPVPIKDEPIYKYYIRLDKYLLKNDIEKRDRILKFINIWYSYKYKKNNYFDKIYFYKNQYYSSMPNDNMSKQFLIKYFNEYNDYFKLDLEYDEELFTTYNVLYFISLMLKTIKSKLIKIVKINEETNEKIKIYTIKCYI